MPALVDEIYASLVADGCWRETCEMLAEQLDRQAMADWLEGAVSGLANSQARNAAKVGPQHRALKESVRQHGTLPQVNWRRLADLFQRRT